MRTINNLLGVVSIILLLSCEGTTGDGNNTNGDIINPEGAPVLTCADFNDDITLEDEPGREVDIAVENPALFLVLFLCLYGVLQLGIFPGNILVVIKQAVSALPF